MPPISSSALHKMPLAPTITLRFQGLHTITLQHALPTANTDIHLTEEAKRFFGGAGLQHYEGQDIFVGAHQNDKAQQLWVATGEGSAPLDERLEARLQTLLKRLGVPGRMLPYVQKYSRQDFKGTFGHFWELDEFHNSGRKVGIVVDKNRLNMFRPNGELAYSSRKFDKNITFMKDGQGDFYVKWPHFKKSFLAFLQRHVANPPATIENE